MPTILVAVQFEAEFGDYFSVVMAWHSRKGLLADRAGLRSLEVHGFIIPYWKKARADPKTAFPKTFARIADLEDEDERKLKREQVVAASYMATACCVCI